MCPGSRSNARRAVVGYACAATAARVGDAGAGLGIVLLAVSTYGTARGAAIGGALAAALTVAHLLGPWTGRLVDSAADPRRPLALGCVWYAVMLAAGVGLLRARLPWPAAVCLLTAGAAGPLLTGGLSSVVRSLSGGAARARSVDALTYGVAGTAAPAVVAVLATVTGPTASLAVVVATVLAAAALLWLVPQSTNDAPAGVDGPRRSAASLLLTIRPLRQVTVTTLAVALTGGALGVLAIRLADELTGQPSRGAWFVAALGIGNLVGAAALVVRPQRGEPVRWSVLGAAALGLGYVAIAAVPTVAVALAVFFTIGLITAPWVTATLTVRDVHAPPGQRAQTFVAMAGWKIAAASAGTALGGVVGMLGARLPILLGGALVLVAVAASLDPRTVRAPAVR
jgi:hypothetical protein